MVSRNTNYRMYRIRDDSCLNCPLRDKCLSHKSARQRYLSIPCGSSEKPEESPSPSVRMQHKVDSKQGKKIYGQRLGNIEPVFGNIRYNKHLNRFTYRTKVKVNTQWLLFCLIHNMEKIAHYGMAI